MRAVRLAVSFSQVSTYMTFHVFQTGVAETHSFHTLKLQPIPVQLVHCSPTLPRSPAGQLMTKHCHLIACVRCGLLSQTYRYKYNKQWPLRLSVSTDHFSRAIISIAAMGSGSRSLRNTEVFQKML
jgi:hypothetical protein